jgi:hypothetical protein
MVAWQALLLSPAATAGDEREDKEHRSRKHEARHNEAVLCYIDLPGAGTVDTQLELTARSTDFGCCRVFGHRSDNKMSVHKWTRRR